MRAIIVIPAQFKDAATIAAKQLDPDGGEHTFDVPLFPVGQDPQAEPAAYWCSMNFADDVLASIRAMLPQFPGASIHEWSEANPDLPSQVLADNGLCTQKNVMFANAVKQ